MPSRLGYFLPMRTPMLGSPDLSFNPLWSEDFWSHKIRFAPPPHPLRHSRQLVLIFTQIGVTRINIKPMHSKQKPPHSPGVDQTEVICPGERDRHMSVNLAVLNFGLGQRSQWSESCAALVGRQNITDDSTCHYIFPSTPSSSVQTLRVSIAFSSRTDSNLTPTQRQGLIYNLGTWTGWTGFFWFCFVFHISARVIVKLKPGVDRATSDTRNTGSLNQPPAHNYNNLTRHVFGFLWRHKSMLERNLSPRVHASICGVVGRPNNFRNHWKLTDLSRTLEDDMRNHLWISHFCTVPINSLY